MAKIRVIPTVAEESQPAQQAQETYEHLAVKALKSHFTLFQESTQEAVWKKGLKRATPATCAALNNCN